MARLQRDDRHAVDLRELAGLEDFRRLLPVDDVQEVSVLRRAARFERRAAVLDAADVAVGAEGVEERPAFGRPLAGGDEVLAVRWQLER